MIIIYGCDPAKEDYYSNNADVVIINAKLLNPKDTFSLGDTVKFYFEVPDSISFNGKKIKANVLSNDFCSFQQTVSILDTNDIANYYLALSSKCVQSAGIGYINQSSRQLYLGKDNGIFKSFYYLIPQKSGIFILEENSYASMYTDNGAVRSSVHFDLGTINRHYDYFINNVTTKKKDVFTQYFSNLGHNKPYEAYVFYVK